MIRYVVPSIATNAELRREAVQWCNDHGINPNHVPLSTAIDIIDDEHLEIEVYDLTADGQKMMFENGDPKTRWLHVKVHRPFPEHLLQ